MINMKLDEEPKYSKLISLFFVFEVVHLLDLLPLEDLEQLQQQQLLLLEEMVVSWLHRRVTIDCLSCCGSRQYCLFSIVFGKKRV
ncbi:unnamed protein product [Cuscuta campestris]|uniref:Uncharacterized protein n=1 Tax=Cuscuta campestris TaxID=132261 RepID=A0A484KUK4_9ASTE|nr:unnamed protein product [Cuscuta campestris]